MLRVHLAAQSLMTMCFMYSAYEHSLNRSLQAGGNAVLVFRTRSYNQIMVTRIKIDDAFRPRGSF